MQLARRAFPAILLLALMLPGTMPARAEQDDTRLLQIVDGPRRDPAGTIRDKYRHPYEVLHFFGLTENMIVVEILPGGSGYWTEILAPYLREHGKYYAALDQVNPSDEYRNGNRDFATKFISWPAFGPVLTSRFDTGSREVAPAGTADMVVTFRNVHSWMATGEADAAYRAFYVALKPGGILGIEEHRGRTDQPQDPLAKSGYVRQDYTVALAEKAGFRLAGSSEINANPKDTKDYAVGVWALPPTYRYGDQDRARYQAIGESDRFVLKFVKPGA